MIHVRLVKEYSPLRAGGIAPEDFQTTRIAQNSIELVYILFFSGFFYFCGTAVHRFLCIFYGDYFCIFVHNVQ
ncbi:hypothetical protein T07_1142 [Trichinella nelsoni]|uniref:Uncharacterized protein n=1 Tax=Trichinella nelsoni TaxID=6336 RepID=A0A0V0RJF4_9BILA|nr:hypothetical protein T07_1142 [Trichinella nelsoni]